MEAQSVRKKSSLAGLCDLSYCFFWLNISCHIFSFVLSALPPIKVHIILCLIMGLLPLRFFSLYLWPTDPLVWVRYGIRISFPVLVRAGYTDVIVCVQGRWLVDHETLDLPLPSSPISLQPPYRSQQKGPFWKLSLWRRKWNVYGLK
jgi:hypothetical protein